MTLPQGFIAPADAHPRPLHIVSRDTLDNWRQGQAPATVAWLAAHGYDASPGSVLALPGGDGGLAGAVLGVGDALDPASYGHAPYALPAGDWQVEGTLDAGARAALQLGWGLGAYRYDRFRAPPRPPARLVLDKPDAETVDVLAASLRVRDLVNTPTESLGPAELEQVVRDIAARHDATVEVITGDELLARNFPAIHAVGRASHREPRLIALRWGNAAHPHVAIVGKGVCFDTGGLNVKLADGMRNMKKDMGGAAHAIALAELVMARKLPMRITLLVPAVENAIGPESYRPGDVIATRKGLHIEIDNTDAEGRVVLGDALAFASEQSPDVLLDFATLTGAARTALGPDLPALYANDETLARQWLDAGMQVRDPLWRMPLWRPYLRYLTSNIADLANSGSSKMAGSISAALYLECFVPQSLPWAHLDVYSWNDSDRPGRPTGGEAQGLRSAYAMLKARCG
ncbi:leucyl aminopeptidase family protein [Cognatiluteimonas profundi]|uniref:leucyl aminopeptidase family protein n=1 Tax=Cognatiluteimonas profundi TaxID=2594501 RepID=UPI00131DECF4|nr:leucyl aminopeptidase family protein [Lysobacter profundi]